jgi:hypothetical protein
MRAAAATDAGAAGPPTRHGPRPVTACGREACLEVARLGAAYCPLKE